MSLKPSIPIFRYSNTPSILRRQQPLHLFGVNVPKGHERHPAVFGFDLYRLVSRLVRLFKPDVFGRFDDLGHVRVESTADYDLNAWLTSFVGTDPDQRQPGSFLLIAYIAPKHLPGNDPSFVVFAEIIEEPDPLFGRNFFATHVDLLTPDLLSPLAPPSTLLRTCFAPLREIVLIRFRFFIAPRRQ